MLLNPSIVPRMWQRQALDKWRQAKRGVVKVVTGGGKTVFACSCIAEFLSEYPEGQIAIIVPTTALLDQWAVDICFATDLQDEDIAVFSGQIKSKVLKKINILVINTARNIAENLFFGSTEPLMLVVDECHRAGAIENSKSMLGKYDGTLGLSATPEREYDDGFEERIEPALGSVIYEYTYKDAFRDGVIVDFDLCNLEIKGMPVSNMDKSTKNPYKHLDGTSREKNFIDVSASNSIKKIEGQMLRILWAVKLALMHAEERVIIFHERINALNLIVDMLLERGVDVVVYHSRLSIAHRKDNLRLFRKGQFRVLATCRALDEGANIPEASIAIIASSTKSTRQRIQRLGRVLRKAPHKQRASIYTIYIGKDEQERLDKEERGLVGVAEVSWVSGVSK